MGVLVLVLVSAVVIAQHKKEESLKLIGVPGFFLELLARFVCIFALMGKNKCFAPPSRREQQSTGLLHLIFQICNRAKKSADPNGSTDFWSC